MKGPFILVVDDERSISEVVSLYLSRAGYRVKIANDGQEAPSLLLFYLSLSLQCVS